MSNSVLIGGAAFRATEGGQTSIHYLSAPLRAVASNPAQNVSAWTSADLTVTRRVAIGSAELHDLRATIAYDGNPQSLSALVAAGRRGATLEYFPSLASPSLSFPCELVEAGDIQPDGSFWWDNRYTVDVVLRRVDGGSWQSVIEAPLFYYRAGNAATGLTFARSGAVGPYVDEDGVLQAAAANIPRVDWLDSVPHLLVAGAARTNLVTSDDLTAWTQVGTAVSAGSIDDPAGGTGAYTITDNDGASVEYVYRSVTFTTDAVKSFVFVVRERGTFPGVGTQQLNCYEQGTTTAYILQLDVTSWVAGEPQITDTVGTLLGKRYIGNGYWAVYARTTSADVSEGHIIEIIPSRNLASAGAIDVYRVNAFNAIDPPMLPLDASEVQAAETFAATYEAVPQAATYYVKFREGMQVDTNWGVAAEIVQVGNAAGTGARLKIYRLSGSGDVYGVQHLNAAAGSSSANIDLNPTWGDEIELCVRIYADGSVDLSGSNEGGTQVDSATSAANTLSAAWGDTLIHFGIASLPGIAGYVECKVIAGTKTLAEMRAL